MNYRAEIDGLRAIAVVPVVLFHAGLPQMSGGFVGVDVFFVVSGFLITSVIVSELKAGQFSFLNFYERRARRILPALFLVLTISSIAAVFILLPYELATFGRGLVAAVFSVSNVLFWRETDYFAAATELNPLVHTWSLAVEEQYYVLCPLVLWAGWRWCPRGLVPSLVLSALASFCLAEFLSTRMPSASFYLLPTRAWELLAGSLTAFYLMRRTALTGWIAEVFAMAGLGAIVASVFVYDAAFRFPSLWALFPVLGTVAIIIAANPSNLVGKVLCAAPLVGIGLISYSAYLWHQPLFAFARLLDAEHAPAILQMLALSVLAFFLAWMSWKFVERPFRSKSAFGRRTIFSMSGIGGVALVSMGVFAVISSGLPQRYPPAQRDWVMEGPIEYGDYVRGAYRGIQNAPLAVARPNVVLVGDSFSQDFYNIIVEAGAFADHSISAIYIPARCQIHFGQKFSEWRTNIEPKDWRMCQEKSLNADHISKMQKADIVIFASRWQPWAAKKFSQSLSAMKLKGKQFVVSSKRFQGNRRALLSFDPSQLEEARIDADDQVLQTSALLAPAVHERNFINLSDILCTPRCALFTNEGALISYDGVHLTPVGVRFLAPRVFASAPLQGYIQP